MPTCKHSDVCGRDALDGHDGKCILHSENLDKDEEAFVEALEEHREDREGDFRYIVFPMEIDFSNNAFEVGANFAGTTFLGEANFAGATFEDGADFYHADFHERAHFLDTDFYGKAKFWGAGFFGDARFRGASFMDAVFHWEADFHDVDFHADTSFSGAEFKGFTSFSGVDFGVVLFRAVTFESQTTFKSAFCDEVQFIKAWFEACKFNGDVLISGQNQDMRAFAGGKVDFRKSEVAQDASLQFRYADLSQCRFLRTDLQDVEFTGVKWCDEVSAGELFSRVGLYEETAGESEEGVRWVDKNPGEYETQRPWPEIERLYRELKKNYEEKGDFPRAGDFHIGEKEARRRNPNTNWGPWVLLWVYRILSKYGERALPAALWLGSLIPAFALLYFALGATTCIPCEPVSYPDALLSSLESTFYPVQSVDFIGFWPQLFSIVQRIISPILLALLALALRQRVKR